MSDELNLDELICVEYLLRSHVAVSHHLQALSALACLEQTVSCYDICVLF